MSGEFVSEGQRGWMATLVNRPSVAIAKAYLKLAPTFPAQHWTAPRELERAQMEYNDEIAGGFLKWFPGVNLSGLSVFDVGSGYGGRAARYRELGADKVVGLEIFPRMIEESRAFARYKGLTNIEFHLGEGEHLPFADDTFGLITSYDVFEHVHELDKVFDECIRVLKPGGRLMAIFPPFYHPGGSHLEGWVSMMPWPNLFFARDVLIQAVKEIMRERNDGYEPNPMRPRDKLWALNGATIRSVRAMLRGRRLRNVRMELAPLFSPMNEKWARWKMRYYAPFFRPLRYIPLLNELFVHRIVLDITK
jgi:SAM-dependent methyltransferase